MEHSIQEYIFAFSMLFFMLVCSVGILSTAITMAIMHITRRATEAKLTYHPEMFDENGHIINEELCAVSFVYEEDDSDYE